MVLRMRMMKTGLACGILLVVTLAGCLEDNDVDGPGSTGTDIQTHTLSDLVCEFTYPDNSSDVPCENQFQELTPVDTTSPKTIPSGWICVDQGSEQDWGYSVHWEPFEEQYGFYYEFPDVDRAVNAVIYKDDESVGAVWYNGDNTGFVHLPDLGQSDPPEMVSKMSIIFYTHDFISDTPALANGTIQALWSFHGGSPYPLQVVESETDSYYFHNVSAKELGADNYTYEVEPFTLEGEDFNITAHSTELKRIQLSWNPRPFFCDLFETPAS